MPAILGAMAELQRVSIFAIVVCNIACNVAVVEANSTSATFRATMALSASCNIALLLFRPAVGPVPLLLKCQTVVSLLEA